MNGKENVDMTTTFSKQEMIQANEFRTLSQKALQQQLREHEKLGILFQSGLDAVMLPYERYEELVNRVNELENILEDLQIEKELGYRLHTPTEQWIERPEGMSTLEMYRQRQKERAGQ